MHVIRTTQPGHRQVRVHLQQLQIARRDTLPLHRVRRFRPVRSLLRQGGPSAQDGEARPRPGRGLLARRSQAGEPAGGSQTVHPTLHPVAGTRLPVPRRQLPPAVVPEDEACRAAHEDLQAQDEGRLPDMQAAHRFVLLPRQTLHGDQVLGSVLQQHKAEVEATASTAARSAATVAEEASGRHEHSGMCGRSTQSASAARARVSATRQACRTRITAQRAEGIAAG